MFRSALWFGVLLALFLFPILCWTWPPTKKELKEWCKNLQWELYEETQQLSEKSDKAIVRWLRKSIDPTGNTPLHILAQEGNLCLLQVCLLRSRPPHCVSVTITNSRGDTPLHFAALNGHLPIVQLLLTHGASVTTTDRWGDTPLHYAARHGHLLIVQLLVAHGASLTALSNSFNKNYDTPLSLAYLWHQRSVVQFLFNPLPPVFNPSPLRHLAAFTVWRAKGRHINRLRALFDGSVPPMLLAVILVELGFVKL